MALYAIDEGELISAWDANKGKIYFCLECFSSVKVRRRRSQFPHFYHLSSSPSCRLYSKSEDHLLLQLQLQKDFPQGDIQLEKPIFPINRVADAVWEKKKIVFEIQCSILYESEAEARIKEYKTAGYDIVWILDDRIFNKRQLRPSEEWLRNRMCYFASVQRFSNSSYFYDQFEILQKRKRIKKSKKIPVDLCKLHPIPQIQRPSYLPQQIERRLSQCIWYFEKDLIHKTLLSKQYSYFAHLLQKWRILEVQLLRKVHFIKKIFYKFICEPYLAMLDALLKRTLFL